MCRSPALEWIPYHVSRVSSHCHIGRYNRMSQQLQSNFGSLNVNPRMNIERAFCCDACVYCTVRKVLEDQSYPSSFAVRMRVACDFISTAMIALAMQDV
eukprot:4655021-Pyramimonas_sp.AAC.1